MARIDDGIKNCEDCNLSNKNERNISPEELYKIIYEPTTNSDSCIENKFEENEFSDNDELKCQEVPYIHLPETEFGAIGELSEVLADENKSLIWFLMKQVRPGMDLSKVVLPTFILEPRSFLDKLSDAYYHADFLTKAVIENDPFERMKLVVLWYMSGFYKKPLGLKKPYNPIIGETFRCYWNHPNDSQTFYIAEQVSHHPPVSAFYVTNRKDGFSISCNILSKSKFYGNSTSAFLEGIVSLTLLPRGEIYTLTTPYIHCKGFLIGTLSMELGGTVFINCENTGYKSEIEFKLKSFMGRSDASNMIVGKIQFGKETYATLSGNWDKEIKIKDLKTNRETAFLSVNEYLKSKRLKRFVVALHAQSINESEKLWEHVTEAIQNNDQIGATVEKTLLEEAQRIHSKNINQGDIEWKPKLFIHDNLTGQWIYKYADLRPWDNRNDIKQYEIQYRILTKTVHKSPETRTIGIISSNYLIIPESEISKSFESTKSIIRLSVDRKKPSEPIDNKSFEKLIIAINNLNQAVAEHSKKLDDIDNSIKQIDLASKGEEEINIFEITLSNFVKVIIYVVLGLIISFIIKWLRD